MIESQTKLPVVEPGSAAIQARTDSVREVLRQRIASEQQALPQDAEARQSSRPAFKSFSAVQSLSHTLRAGLSRWLGADAEAQPLLNRYALHLLIFLLAFGVVTATRVRLPTIEFLLPRLPASYEPEVETVYSQPVNSQALVRLVNNNSPILIQGIVPHTTIPDRVEEMAIITYTVQPNDTVYGIAQSFDIEVETIMWANAEVEKDPDLLSVGQVLTILPVNGIYYTVKAGDTVDKLAKTYKTTKEKITGLALNGLVEPYTLVTGQKLVLVDGQKPIAPRAPADFGPLQFVGKPPKDAATGSGRFMWPTVGYWSRGFSRYHFGADIANRTGTPIYAADAGYVRLAGRDTAGYGLQIVIDHGNGFMTRYAHLSKILVKAGESVTRGQKIGLMGSTGRSTGPHLHFEIIKNGVRVNPVSYLPH